MKKETLFQRTEKTIDLDGLGTVRIRRLSLSEALGLEGSVSEQARKLITAALVDPKISFDEAGDIPAHIALKLQSAIIEFNELSSSDKDAKPGN
jgi:hypothetical protein